MMMIREEKWDDLKAIQGSVDVVSACLSQKHAGVPGCWLRSTASETLACICKDFAKSPLLTPTLALLQEWGGRKAIDSVHQILHEFSGSWDLQWEKQKEDLVKSEQWQRLQQMSETRQRLLTTLSSDVKVATPDQHQALQELRNLKYISCLGFFPALDRAIQRLSPLTSDGPGDTHGEKGFDDAQLNQTELSAASSRQPDIHYLNGQ